MCRDQYFPKHHCASKTVIVLQEIATEGIPEDKVFSINFDDKVDVQAEDIVGILRVKRKNSKKWTK